VGLEPLGFGEVLKRLDARLVRITIEYMPDRGAEIEPVADEGERGTAGIWNGRAGGSSWGYLEG